ncbi:ORC-CDC6 family AAA ATPase [Phaeobacter marinintestinus]|uniref:ORC-CDC6 family AAA ATPase n=1 Tax=Falsiphaeobacter marinintestinus TaxID=1492905 RepID=UPI0011B3FCAF|nr:hypothetical protein [Phaeobacter marinintestinus]
MTDVNAIHDLFGSFRAEWLREDIYKLFSEPAYFAHLTGNKSCVLVGGRGSGKTTALRCLSYEGQIALGQQIWASPSHVGIYYKVNTNIVTAFDGPDLDVDEWRRLFGHFLNLIVCGELANYVSRFAAENENCDLTGISFDRVGMALGLGSVSGLTQLREGIAEASARLELYINNLGSDRPMVSQLQSPIAHFLQQLKSLHGHESVGFHIIFDEYENLLDYQQQIVNTLIKHSGDNCYFKIGVRELGWRIHTTLNENESLISPADYELIHIEERIGSDFGDFARNVCEARLESNETVIGEHLGLDELLPTLSTLEEAERLGVAKRVSQLRKEIRNKQDDEGVALSQHDFALYVFSELNKRDIDATISDLEDYANRNSSAVNKYQNYAHALLFSIADRGTSITKHYCGHDTFSRIANGNLRFYMQLVHESIVQQISVEKNLAQPIDCRDQTIAARRVGLNYLRELEGATARGSHLSKLILGFGRFFQILASNPVGAAPEYNQFYIKDSGQVAPTELREEAARLLTDAIMHLALVRSPGTKLSSESDTRAWDYSPHPIFSPYFNYSSRRKRKTGITDADLVGMSKTPQDVIRKLLGESRQHLADAELPAQMSMFDDFYK